MAVYGLFQAAVIQQDGVIELRAAAEASTYAKVRGVVDAADPILVKNRELRDQLVGHPANKSWKTNAPTAATFYRNFPDRFRLSAAVYDLQNGAFRKEDIDVKSTIERQAQALSSALSTVIEWARKPS